VTPPFRRAIVIVMDSVGVGELPDASAYGDQGSNTVGNIAKRVPLKVPTLRSRGCDRLVRLDGSEKTAENAKNAKIFLERDFSASFALSAVFFGS